MKKLIPLFLVVFLIGCSRNNMPNNPGGTSSIYYLQKVRDGVVFYEGFENDNFINAEGWTTLHGVPANTSAQYKQGIKSWDNTANAQSLPVAKKVITDTNVDPNWYFSCFFYDDSTNITDQGPFVKLKLVDGKFLQMGVRNSTSTTFYSTGTSAFTEDVFHASTGSRLTGWRFFTIIYISSLSTYRYYLDDNLIDTASSVTSSPVSEIYIQANTVGGTGNSFGYFDAVSYNRAETMQVVLPFSATVKLNDSNNFNVDSQSGNSTSPAAFELWNEAGSIGELFPFSVYMEIVDSSKVFQTRTPLTSVNPGDIFSLKKLSFGRKCEMLGYVPNSFRQTNQSPSGVVETLVTGLKDRLAFMVKELQGFQWVQVARDWFQYAIDGSPFSIVTDSSFDTAMGVVSATVLATNTTVTIMPNGSTNPTDSFNVNTITNGEFANNYFYVVRNNANTQKQIVSVASKTGTTLTFNEQLNFNVGLLDYVYSEYLFPFMEIDGNDLSGFVIADKNIPSYTWTQKVREYNNS